MGIWHWEENQESTGIYCNYFSNIYGCQCPVVFGALIFYVIQPLLYNKQKSQWLIAKAFVLTHALHVNWGSAGLGSRPCPTCRSSPYGSHFSGTVGYLVHVHSKHVPNLYYIMSTNIPLATASHMAKPKFKRTYIFYTKDHGKEMNLQCNLMEMEKWENIMQSSTCPKHTFLWLKLGWDLTPFVSDAECFSRLPLDLWVMWICQQWHFH